MGIGNMSNKGKKLSGNHSKTIIRVMWWSLACFMAFLLILSMLIYNGVIGYMPPVEELMHPRDRYATPSTPPTVWKWANSTAARAIARMWILSRCRLT